FHAFAGIGGWPFALRLAGWPDDVAVWTGSCPCQPFSVAGKRKGAADERNLWPQWRRLIAQCHPSIIFGEQVTGQAGVAWLSNVRRDLEALGYAVGAADLCAAGIGAPHLRQRLFWVAYANCQRLEGPPAGDDKEGTGQPGVSRPVDWADCDWIPGRDGRARPVEPGTFPLAHGLPQRVGRLRAYGNAIVPELAATFIRSVIDVLTPPEALPQATPRR
ncbi:MAG: DNA cytosine methyltransferase, partial [Gammaproteobacteria bacterium]|nr:DNA cytosine methyltransferase [Gammaproteobacteria bacterium]